MAARPRVALLALFAGVLCVTQPVRAQQLAPLHVQSMTLTTDTARPKAGVPFDLVLTIRVRENLASLQNVVLPAFIGPEELGDERMLSHRASGTVYRETLRLVAHAHGDLAIGPAYLDAVDARDGKPKRFLSNGLTLYVDGADALAPGFAIGSVLGAFGELLLIVAALAAIAMLLRRSRRVVQPLEPAREQPVAPPPAPLEQRLDAAIETLAQHPAREALSRVRDLLWEYAGAPPGGTLADALAASDGAPAHVRAMLCAVERATFVEDWQFADAVARVVQLREVPV